MFSPETEYRNIFSDNISLNSVRQGKLEYLDGWRGLAILLVLYAHFVSKSHLGWVQSGRFGVNIFFCLSGLLMSNILFEKRVSLMHFYKRRISRLMPVFLLFVCSIYSFFWLTKYVFSWYEFLPTVLFLRTYLPASPDIRHSSVPIVHLWSLNAEAHGYILIGLLALLPQIRGREGMALIFLGSISALINAFYVSTSFFDPSISTLRTEAVAAHFLISAGYFLVRHKFSDFVKPSMPVLAFFMALLCHTSVCGPVVRAVISPFLLAFAVNHLDSSPKIVKWILSLSVFRLFGLWSYSIYLWQQPFYVYQDYVFPGLAFLMALTVALCSFYFVENPLRVWLNERW